MNENKNVLLELAQYLGIQTHYENAFGEIIECRADVLIKILNSLGIKIRTIEESGKILKDLILEKLNQKIDDIYVLWDGKGKITLNLTKKELDAPIYYEIHLEYESTIKKKINIAPSKVKKILEQGMTYFETLIQLPQLPLGYHQLTLIISDKKYHCFIISAPRQMYTERVMSQDKLYGIFSPIYALHDAQSLDCGDLGTLSRFSKYIADQGGKIVGTMPFFSSFLKENYEPSPYSPVSRMFWNELYLDLNALGIDLKKYPKPKNGKKGRVIDLKKIASFKREIIEKEMEKYLSRPETEKEFQTYVAENPEIKNYAWFQTQFEKSESAKDFRRKAENPDKQTSKESSNPTYRYHLFVQWQMAKQLKSLKKQINEQSQLLYLDLPVGVHQEGFDSWYFREDFVQNMTIGAPPDPVYKQGQNWGSPPLNPMTIRKNHYAYLINMLRNILPYVDVLRIDHVMGFNRLFWIPELCNPEEGAYVQYNTEEIYAILSVESNRYKTTFIGENLGLVPKSTNQMMKKHAMLQMHIVQYLLESKIKLTPQSELMLTSLNTHDMPTFYSYCHSIDIKNNFENKIISAEDYEKELNLRKKNINKLKKFLQKDGDTESTLIQSVLKFLAQSQAQILMINIEDLWSEVYSQNIPGQKNESNWRRSLAYSLEDIALLPDVKNTLDCVNLWRKNEMEPDIHAQQELRISSHDIYLFNEGRHFKLYEHLGAHPLIKNGVQGINFAVWAPNAEKVSVIGSFNSWDVNKHDMHMLEHSGIWEVFIPEAREGDLYKFHIQSKHHMHRSERSDPFAFYQEIAPKTASIIWHSHFEWNDEQWMKKRHQYQNVHAPISIYEVHLGSWRRVIEDEDRPLTYRELAPLLTEYVLSMNFTHVEFLPLMEHPFYGSWGYQTLGYFAPSSRYGSPDDFKFLIDYLHHNNIGVILDWVPSHFPNDLHGLAYFDGTHLYEHADPKKGFHPDWKSAIFNYGRHEIKSFLISSALFWLDQYHVDGIRVDAVASMLYLNYSRNEGEWIPNIYGGHENLEAIQFLKELNEVLYLNYPDIQTFAEESTAWPGVSRPTYLGGLGFGFKWDMGWMHDTLSYLSKDPIHRSYHQHQLTFRMIYAFTENFVLSLSHDEVVHGKGSLINKMPGNEWEQFANLRLLFGYMFGMPGKKLMFMGNEFGQRSEWRHEYSLDWHLLQYEYHAGIQKWVSRLNQLYKSENALHDYDHNPTGFEWIDANDSQNSVYSFLRKSHNNEIILVLINCTPISRLMYRVGVPSSQKWHLLVSSDDKDFGGADRFPKELIAESVPFHGREHSLTLDIPGLSMGFYKCT